MAEWDPPAQSSHWSSEVQAAPLEEVSFPKETQLQTATISLWTVVGAVQAVERTVEAQALRLLSLEQRSGTAEKRFADCEKAVAELGSRLDSRWSALGTVLQEYGQLQRRLENLETLLKNWNFWVLKVPVGTTGEGSKISATFGDCSTHFSREKWERLEDWQKELYKNVVKGNCESLISLDFAVSKLESLACAEQGGDPPPVLGQAASEGQPPQSPSDPKTDYTVSKLDPLPSDGEGGLPCVPLQTDVEMEAHKSFSSDKEEPPASRTDVISWIKQEDQPTARDARDSAQLQTEDHQAEDPANPPLLLFFPGGSVAPIFNGAIGESQPLSSLRGPRTTGGTPPSSPAAALEAAMERPHTCADCGKTFSLLLSLQIHQMNHRKRKQYACTFCGGAFSCPSELVRHQMIHTGERPYKCTVCGKGFVRKQHLIPHLRLHTGERPYRCAQCGKAFICKHHLMEHQRTHTGERPYACTACGKAFRRKKSLKDHVRMHRAGPGQAASSARDPPQEPQPPPTEIRGGNVW
ncbi:zinc finger protein 282-like [Elgaria multicarinata webbii]|uniref:zinc finger protein 282-like n=1 Tax=Elgaria multicarinata webbii TaxID=159646 RepID=UPI002FCD4975